MGIALEHKVIINSFDTQKHKKSINAIKNEKVHLYKETHFIKIATDILEKQKFKNIKIGLSSYKARSIPFDILAKKGNVLSLIELKGSWSTFNFSNEVQFSRLYQVVQELKKRNIKCDTYLLQINLKYGLFQIYGNDFYKNIFQKIDKSAGKKIKNIKQIVDNIEETVSI